MQEKDKKVRLRRTNGGMVRGGTKGENEGQINNRVGGESRIQVKEKRKTKCEVVRGGTKGENWTAEIENDSLHENKLNIRKEQGEWRAVVRK